MKNISMIAAIDFNRVELRNNMEYGLVINI